MFHYKSIQNTGSTAEKEATKSEAGMVHSPTEAVRSTWSDHTALGKMLLYNLNYSWMFKTKCVISDSLWKPLEITLKMYCNVKLFPWRQGNSSSLVVKTLMDIFSYVSCSVLASNMREGRKHPAMSLETQAHKHRVQRGHGGFTEGGGITVTWSAELRQTPWYINDQQDGESHPSWSCWEIKLWNTCFHSALLAQKPWQVPVTTINHTISFPADLRDT